MVQGRRWCTIEMDYFPLTDFEQVGERAQHAHNLPAPGNRPHFADGYADKIAPWRAPIRIADSQEGKRSVRAGRGGRKAQARAGDLRQAAIERSARHETTTVPGR